MKVLIVGSGGREHALAWKVSQSDLVSKIYCAPGNPGTAQLGENIAISPMDFENLIKFVQEDSIDLTIVGPEDPLVEGIVDKFESNKLKIFGPSRNAAQLEGSKRFAKELMQKYKIPTAQYASFINSGEARTFLSEEAQFPIVLKASGLAAGKGVLICQSIEEGLSGVRLIMEDKAFGDAGDSIIIEEFLEGEEISIFALCDGKDFLLLSPAQDHKKVYNGDKGKNTGGMGAYAPTPVVKKSLMLDIKSRIIVPTLQAMASENMPYKGLLYFGLILTAQGIRVLEYNCRVPLIMATIDGDIKNHTVQMHKGFAIDVVVASGGYPDAYEKGKKIGGLNALDPDILVFHAGTKMINDTLVTNGGRVLNIVARGDEFVSLSKHIYDNMGHISFEGAHYRTDIGYRAKAYLKNNVSIK
jgi:phosphoribosylamine--glycine ligase